MANALFKTFFITNYLTAKEEKKYGRCRKKDYKNYRREPAKDS
jgi:hypothetical protein